MQIHGSCAALDGAAVLLLGPPGSGKSDLTLRLLDRGFQLVADDRVEIDAEGWAQAPAALRGLLEVRGLGIIRLAALARARLALAVELGSPDRLPLPRRHAAVGIPLIRLDPRPASAAQLVSLALACALGRISQAAGAFA